MLPPTTVCFFYMSYLKYSAPLAACILMAFFATPVLAQTAVDVGASATIETGTPGAPLMKPLDFIKARAKEIQGGGQPGKMEMRGDLKMKDRAASSSDERKDPAKMRMASTTPGHGLKALIQMHGGVIKNRFNLAIAHMENILARIETRLEKIAAEGIDTSAVVTLHTSAEVAVDKAEADAKAVADFAATASDASDRAAFKTQLETKLRTAHQSVKAAHKAVMDTVRALVSLARNTKKVEVEAETSVESDVQ